MSLVLHTSVSGEVVPRHPLHQALPVIAFSGGPESQERIDDRSSNATAGSLKTASGLYTLTLEQRRATGNRELDGKVDRNTVHEIGDSTGQLSGGPWGEGEIDSSAMAS